MTKAEIEIKNLKKNLNSDEAYFFLSSIIDADKENSPKRRVRRLLSFLREHKKFKETILEFYLKSPKAKFPLKTSAFRQFLPAIYFC